MHCEPCSIFCTSCEHNPIFCYGCIDGYTLLSNSCNGCDNLCKTCEITTTHCTSCAIEVELLFDDINFTCYCIDGQYVDPDYAC